MLPPSTASLRLLSSLAVILVCIHAIAAQDGKSLYERDVVRRRNAGLVPRAQKSTVPPPPSGPSVSNLGIPDGDFNTCKPPAAGFRLTQTAITPASGTTPGTLTCSYDNPTTGANGYCNYNVDGTFRNSAYDAGCLPGDLDRAPPYSETCFTVCSTSQPGGFTGSVLALSQLYDLYKLTCYFGGFANCQFDARTGQQVGSYPPSYPCTGYSAARGNCFSGS